MECDFYNYDGELVKCSIDRRKKEAHINGFLIYGNDYEMIFGLGGDDLRGKTRREIVSEVLPEVYFWWFTL